MRIVVWMCAVWAIGIAGAQGQGLGQGASQGVTVTGIVVDSSGGVVPGVDVELAAIASAPGAEGAAQHATTDGAGQFRFEHVSPDPVAFGLRSQALSQRRCN